MERLGAFTFRERKERILWRAEQLGWPIAAHIYGNEANWRRQIAQALPGHLDDVERALGPLEAAAERRAAFNAEERRRDEINERLRQDDVRAQRRLLGIK